MKRCSMNTTLSTVLLMVAFSPSSSFSQTTTPTQISCDAKRLNGLIDSMVARAKERAGKSNLSPEEHRRIDSEAAGLCIGQITLGENNPNSCASKSTELRKASAEFAGACAAAGLTGEPVSCAAEMRKCSSRESVGSSDDIDLDVSEKRRKRSSSNRKSAPRKVTPNINAAREEFEYCRVFANEDLEEWKEQVEAAEEKMQKLQESVTKAQEELANLQAESAKALEDIQRAWEDAQETAQKAIDALEGKIQDFDEALAERARKTLENVRNLYGQIATVEGQIVAAANQRDAQRTTLNLKCYEVALAKVAELRAAKQELIKKNLYTAGGFNNLMRSVGLTNLKASETLARDYYSRCIGDMAYKENMRVAEKAHDSAVKAMNNQIAMFRLQIIEQEKELNRIQNELQAKGMANFQKERDQIVTALNKAQARAQRDTANTQQKYASLLQAKNQSIQQLQFQLETAEDHFDQKAAYLALKNQYATKNATKAEVNEAFAKHGLVQATAEAVVSSCGSLEVARCEDARRYLGEDSSGLFTCTDQTTDTQSSQAALGSGLAAPRAVDAGGVGGSDDPQTPGATPVAE